VSGRRVEIVPEPTEAERRAIEIALERGDEPRPPRPAGWLEDGGDDGADG
jgi:hypothetical protein